MIEDPVTNVKSYFDAATWTITHVIWDGEEAAVIDSVLDFDPASGMTSTASADQVIAFIREKGLKLCYILETHIHADHITASQHIRQTLGGKIAISEKIGEVQAAFAEIFNEDPEEIKKEADFDLHLKDGDELALGQTVVKVLATPGHTPACLTYLWQGAAFIGDTLFMPDSGTARCDFPGGEAETLYLSIQKLLALPDDTVLYLCHDYGAGGIREVAWDTTIREQKENNIHVGGGTPESDYIKMREARDATLSMPRLLLSSVQINMRAGNFPAEKDNGVSYLNLPLNYFD